MPTSNRSGATKPGAPKPAPDAQEGGVKPQLQGPLEKPHPVLQHAGFVGGIQQFNAKVQQAVEAHRHGLGKDPSPGLVLDVVRSPVDPQDYGRLFELPANPRIARLNHVNRASDEDTFQQRPDGLFQPVFRSVQNALAQAAPVESQHTPLPPQEAMKQYPWVAEGFLPVEKFPALVEALKALSAPDKQAQIQQGGLSLDQYIGQVRKANAAGDIQKALDIRSQQGPDVVHLTTVKEAQVELNKLMGTALPTTGYINSDWASALSNWQKSRDYFRKTTRFLADKQGMTVPDFTRAWTNQQDAIRRTPLASHFIASMPLGLWVHPNSAWGNTKDLGAYLKGNSNTPWDIGLHGLTRTVGLTLGAIGGTVSSVKADAAAANALTESMALHPGDREGALKHARTVLKANPSWLRVVDPSLPAHPKGWLGAIDQASNLAVDLIVLRKPALTGETVAYADVPAAMRSSYLHVSSNMAYDYLKKGQVGRASSMLESGSGAEKLATVAEPLIKRGLLTRAQFKFHLADLYASGETIIPVKGRFITVEGPALDSLRSAKLVTPGRSGQGWKILEAKARDWADGLHGNNLVTDSAVSFVNKLRSEFSHAVAPGKHSYYDPRLPERIHDFTLATFKDAGLANKWESDFVRARAKENVPGMQAVFEKVNNLYHEKFPVGASDSPAEPFQALLGTEAPSIARFPSGGTAEDRYLASIQDGVKGANGLLNRIGRLHAKVIVSGFPLVYIGGRSLFYKHMIADTARRYAGGGFIVGKGIGGTAKEWDAFLKANPEYERSYGAFLERNIKGETRWLLNRGQAVNRTSFQTSERFGEKPYMDQAGAYLRRHLLDDAAMDGFLKSSASNIEPLVQSVLHDRELRGMWKSARKTTPDLSAEEYAALIFERYQNLREAGAAAGVDPLADGMAVLRANRGASVDRKLGEWIASNKLDFKVGGAQVTRDSGFDALMNKQIEHLMVFNKWNRGGMARNVFLHHWQQATRAGIEPGNAAKLAMSVAEKQTVFHMLDFANRLKIEQDLRWVSYFATKHRLYWKWLMSTFIRQPRYAVATEDVRQHLDAKGNSAPVFSLLGYKWQVPVARLFWVPGKEYSETSYTAQAFLAAAKGLKAGPAGAVQSLLNSTAGTNGNIFTRSDEGIALGFKWVGMMTGQVPATYGAALTLLPAKQAEFLRRDFNLYQIEYTAKHGHPAPEGDVVKAVLWRNAAMSLHQSNLPVPVVPQSEDRSGQQKLVAEFMALNDPAKRREFFDKHPGFSDHFGIYDDPKTFLHNREYFARFHDLQGAYTAGREKILLAIEQQGFTPDLKREYDALTKRHAADVNAMLVQDAQASGIRVPAGRVPNGDSIKFGPWGKLLNADPLLDPQKALTALFPKLDPKEYGKIIGSVQKDLEHNLRLLNDKTYTKGLTEGQIKEQRKWILIQLEPFRAYPKDALGKLQATYATKYQHPYFTENDRWYNRIHSAPRTEQAGLKAQWYAWREKQDRPVTIDGVKFPSPVRMYWAGLDPAAREKKLAYLASADWQHLTGYEKQVMGLEGKNVDQGWLYLEQAKEAYRKENPGQSVHEDQLRAVAKQIEKVVPGFYKDYLFAQQPLIRRYEHMSLYVDMPRQDRGKFDQYIGNAARTAAAAVKSGDYSASEVRAGWVNYIDTAIKPWLASPEQASLRKRLGLYGPNFLHSLISK